MVRNQSMTNHEMIIKYIKEFGSLTPAKMIGKFYENKIWPAELSKRCRELRSQKRLYSERDGKFEVFYLNEERASEKPISSKVQDINNLDEALRAIIKTITPCWENYDKIQEIQKAIKAKHESTKKAVINKYK